MFLGILAGLVSVSGAGGWLMCCFSVRGWRVADVLFQGLEGGCCVVSVSGAGGWLMCCFSVRGWRVADVLFQGLEGG